jgi:hypothetical protein
MDVGLNDVGQFRTGKASGSGEWRMGKGEWGMGSGEWGMGNGGKRRAASGCWGPLTTLWLHRCRGQARFQRLEPGWGPLTTLWLPRCGVPGGGFCLDQNLGMRYVFGNWEDLGNVGTDKRSA